MAHWVCHVSHHPLVTDVITAEIAKRKARFDRMPKHWEARRIEEMVAIEALIDQLLALREAGH